MLPNLSKFTRDEWFVLVAFVLSLLVSFLFGYMVFRYVQIDFCKSPIEMMAQG